MSSSVRFPVELAYPGSDATPMAASAAQGIPLRYPATGLRDYFRDRHDGYVSGNHAAMLTKNTVDDQSEQSSNSVTATVNGATRSWGYYRKSPPCGWSGQGDRHRAHGDHYTDAVDSGGNGSGHRSVPDCAAGDGYDAAQRTLLS